LRDGAAQGGRWSGVTDWHLFVLPLVALGGVVFQAGISYSTMRHLENQIIEDRRLIEVQRAEDLRRIEKRLDKIEDRLFNGGDR
jgi:membrane protein DedA with SNARE-associated domain